MQSATRVVELVAVVYRDGGTGGQAAVVEARCACGWVGVGRSLAEAWASGEAHRCHG